MTTLKSFAATVLCACLGASVWALPAAFRAPSVASNSPIMGDYVEARTAAVFAGACHYNGEYSTTGRDALMAWNFTAGSHQGVSLAGVRAAAAITSEENLAEAAIPHKAELIVDPSASKAQVDAVVALLKAKCGDSLGTIVTVRRAPITFAHTDKGYTVSAPGFATLAVQYMPDDSCCTQSGDVWYTSLSPVVKRKVGFTEFASYAGVMTGPWHRSTENSAIYGAIAF